MRLCRSKLPLSARVSVTSVKVTSTASMQESAPQRRLLRHIIGATFLEFLSLCLLFCHLSKSSRKKPLASLLFHSLGPLTFPTNSPLRSII